LIYDYLFFKSYQLAQRSKNFDDAPVLGGIWGVMVGFMFNVFTLILILDTVFKSSIANNDIFTKGKYIVAIVIIALLWLYFKQGKRWVKIIAKYEERELNKNKSIHPAIVLVIYYVLSAAILFLAAMYKNGDGIFG